MRPGYDWALACLVLTMQVPASVQGVPSEDYRPDWTVGQKWTVEVLRKVWPVRASGWSEKHKSGVGPRQLSMLYEFQVEAVQEIEGTPYWRVRVGCTGVDGHDVSGQGFSRFYFMKDDLSLKRKDRIRTGSDKAEHTQNLGGGRPVIGVECGYLPMAFPLFSAGTAEYKPKKHKQESGPDYHDEKEAYQTCSIKKMPDGQKALKIYLEEKYERNPKDPKPEAVKDGQVEMDRNTRRSATQIWQKGMPWWSEMEAKERRNTEGVSIRLTRARLVSVNGTALPGVQPTANVKSDRWRGLTEEEALKNVASTDREERNLAVAFLLAKRRERTKRLIEVIGNTSPTDEEDAMPRAVAALLLGQMRASEASRVLVDAMVVEARTRPVAVAVSPAARHRPFRRALSAIGKPAARALMRKIKTEDGAIVTAECAGVLCDVATAQGAMAMLKEAYDSPTMDEETKDRLQKAMTRVAKRLK